MNKDRILPILFDNNEFRLITKDYRVNYEHGVIRIRNDTGEVLVAVAKTKHPSIVVDSAFTKHKEFIPLDWTQDVISELNEVVSELIYDVFLAKPL